jgi:hypothetical protein
LAKLGAHHLRIKARDWKSSGPPEPASHAEAVRSWLTALVGAEHLSLLVGSGLGIAVTSNLGLTGLDMGLVDLKARGAGEVIAHATASALKSGRGDEPNVEDQFRSALALLAGLEVLDSEGQQAVEWRECLAVALADFAKRGLTAEQEIRAKITSGGEEAEKVEQSLLEFFLGLSGRPPSRERLNVFTTNYDRLIEFGCDRGGIRVLDRFVGSIEPVFRASRLNVDLHYNPPGIRGEPRYLEGVIRLSKLHGSLDWRMDGGRLRRMPLEFGGSDDALEDPENEEFLKRLMIYPNAAKDVETLEFPYAELFRDFSAAICQPNSVLVTFGYGFGDDHVNRVIKDMLTLQSTHLLIISYSDPGQRIENFLSGVRPEQSSLLLGDHFGDLAVLVREYMPHLSAEGILQRQAKRDRDLAYGDSRKQDPDTGEHTPSGSADAS